MTPRSLTFALIADIGRQHGVPLSAILNSGIRHPSVVRARWAAIRAVHEARPHLSLKQVAGIFRMHHTSVLNALQRTHRSREQAARRLAA